MEELQKKRKETIEKVTKYLALELCEPFVLVIQRPFLSPFKPVDVSGNIPGKEFNLELLHQAMILLSNSKSETEPYNNDSDTRE